MLFDKVDHGAWGQHPDVTMAALPQHSAVSLRLTDQSSHTPFREAEPRDVFFRYAPVRQSLTALCGGKAALNDLVASTRINHTTVNVASRRNKHEAKCATA